METKGNASLISNEEERVAQIVFTPYVAADFAVVDELSDTNRGAGGFGSTGKK